MVLGILGFFTCITALPAFILGIIGVTKTGPGSGYKGRGMAIAGIVMSAICILGFPIMLSIMIPAGSGLISQSRRTKDAVNQRAIALTLIDYAKEHDGEFPNLDEDGEPFTSSTEVFNMLIRDYGLHETMFYIPGNPDKRSLPNGDGILQPHENCMIYVRGQNDSMPANSPLVADEMEAPGIYGKYHPWLKDGWAIVAYVGGYAKAERLTSKQAPATVKGPEGSGIVDIFQEISVDASGVNTGGLLAVDPENILLPEAK